MSWQIVRLDDVRPSTWKNGGGQTRELLAWPSGDAWQLRVSVADIDRNGPFSRFEGVQRWFSVLEGGGVRLSVDGRSSDLSCSSEPFEFAGDAATDCVLLDGATRDFNFMVRGRRARMRRTGGHQVAMHHFVSHAKSSHEHDSQAGEVRGPEDSGCMWIGFYSPLDPMSILDRTQRIEVPPRCLAWRSAVQPGQRGAVATGSRLEDRTPWCAEEPTEGRVEGRDLLILEVFE